MLRPPKITQLWTIKNYPSRRGSVTSLLLLSTASTRNLLDLLIINHNQNQFGPLLIRINSQDIIKFMDIDESGWALGQIDGRTGWFPLELVKPLDPTAITSGGTSSWHPKSVLSLSLSSLPLSDQRRHVISLLSFSMSLPDSMVILRIWSLIFLLSAAHNTLQQHHTIHYDTLSGLCFLSLSLSLSLSLLHTLTLFAISFLTWPQRLLWIRGLFFLSRAAHLTI